MAPARIPLSLDPARCDRCGRCTTACEAGALKVGSSYIFVDWRTCDGCLKCAHACDTGAITPREAGRAPRAAGAPAGSAARTTRTAPAARPRAAPPAADAPQWSLLEAAALLAALLATFLGKDAVMMSAAVRSLESESAVFARVAVLFGFYALQAGVLLLLARLRGMDVVSAYRLRITEVGLRERLASVGLVVGLLVATRLGGWIYGLTAQGLGWDPPMREVGDLTEVFGPTVWGLLLSVALVVVVAPLVEEVVFRGVLQGAFVGRWGSRIGIGLAAGIFALYHFTPWLWVPLFVLGVACGWLAETRRSLAPAIWLHGAYNVVPVVIAFYLVW